MTVPHDLTCPEACEILRGARREIEEEYARRLKGVGPRYADRPIEELRATTAGAVAAYLAVLCDGDWGPMERFVREIGERRFALGFPMSEVQRAFALFRELCHPRLTERLEGPVLDQALDRLDRVVDEAIHRFSDAYQELHLEEIRRKTEELADAHRKLQEQYREVAEAARIKSQFFANMSHELRSPLNSVIGYAELLLDGIDGPVTEAQRADLEKIRSGARYLLKLINNILDMTRIEAGRMEVEIRPFELELVLREAVDTVAPLAYRKGLDLRVEVEPGLGPVRSDEEKVKQVAINLLANAVKFTERGAIVCRARREGGGVRVEVEDTGAGVAPEDRDRIFTKFYQADASHGRGHRGTGLGLPLSRMLVELLGGRMGLESELGRGSLFWFWIPDAEAGREAEARERPLVLVVEDDPAAQELLRRFLETGDYEVIAADDGAEGLEIAREKRPDVITLDLLMPRVDGWELLRRLKADPATREISVVVVTCMDRQDQALREGAAALLVKPVERAELLDAMGRALGREG